MSAGGIRQNKLKELLARHTDLEQSQNKAQGALLSVLALTQVTELKILLDVGTHRHKLYHFVLALLIGSIALQIIVGVIVIYIGHLRYQKESIHGGSRRRASWTTRLAACFTGCCTCDDRKSCCCRQKRTMKRRPSYISVPIGVGTTQPKVAGTLEEMYGSRSDDLDDDSSDGGVGCCDWSRTVEDSRRLTGSGNASTTVARQAAEVEAARVKMANAVAAILRITNEIETLEAEVKSSSSPGGGSSAGSVRKTPPVPSSINRDPAAEREMEKQLTELRVDLNIARREKEQADAELSLAESRQKQAASAAAEQEERDELLTFRRIRSWQQVALYLLYFITLMNIFVTAIGISVA